jgi:hypothetical protein
MHKVILMLWLAFASNGAQAAWALVTSNEEAAIYADISSLSISGDMVKMWDIADFKQKIAGVNYSSVKSQREYDCKAKQNRTLSYSTMSKSMAGGLVVKSSNFSRPWSPVYSGGIVAALWKTACAKR